MCVPSLNEIHESIFEVSGTQVKTYGGGVTEVKPVYPQHSPRHIIEVLTVFFKYILFNFKLNETHGLPKRASITLY